MELRELTAADAAATAAIEADVFAGETPWSRDVFLVEFAHPYTFYVGAFDDGELVGYAGLAKLGPADDPEFEVHTIAVARGHQRRGIGRVLMDQLVHAADMHDGQMFLEVRTDNTAALALYVSYGFIEIGVRKGYYQPTGADAYTMMRASLSERAEREHVDGSDAAQEGRGA
ncbi:ribosomal protein S18-alanine N-acetyltransferase [Corynebacterium urinipleomorphum]|uniref:ribosomal protein S18-alanine N-acetyltransferase n=1 Tax=Corynebacterium urinipleomorphum TaxID=1852380 RepID=UPI000B362A85|nr:ribosomal protein S18-alanine N-acetyltransferase [Corynebacterium urinipleomorphum]